MTLGQADSSNWTLWATLAALCSVALLVTFLRRQQFLSWALRHVEREERAARREQRDVARLATEVLSQLDAASTRMSEELASKAEELRKLIAAADAQMESLRRELPSSRPTGATGALRLESQLTESAAAAQSAETIELSIDGKQLALPAAAGRPRLRLRDRESRSVEKRESAASVPPLASPLANDDLPPTMLRVWELADEGLGATQIAETTGLMLGEVELLLNLRKLR